MLVSGSHVVRKTTDYGQYICWLMMPAHMLQVQLIAGRTAPNNAVAQTEKS